MQAVARQLLMPKKAVAKAVPKKAVAKTEPKKAVAKDVPKKAFAKSVAKKAPAQPPPDSPLIKFFDRYLGRSTCVAAKQLGQTMFPCHLVCAAMFFHTQRSHQPPPPFPSGVLMQFPLLQLQRFLRSCVTATARALATPPASVFVYERHRWRCMNRVFVRVMSGFVARAEVRRQGARCTCACS